MAMRSIASQSRALRSHHHGARNVAKNAVMYQEMRWSMAMRRTAAASAASGAAATTAQAEAPATAAAEPTAAAAAAAAPPPETQLDIRVGRVLSAAVHPDADTLYVEQVECGDADGPRTIVSGLVKYVKLEELEGRRVVVLANLKARNMRGVKSNGMLLCASNADHTAVEPLLPPEGAGIGERCYFGEAGAAQGPPAEPNRVQKKKVWEAVQPDLKTDGARVAGYKGAPMLTSAGPVTAPSLAGASIS